MRAWIVAALVVGLSPSIARAQLHDYFPQPTDPSARRHDGLFLRLGLGSSFVYDAFDGPLWDDGSSLAATSSFEASFGHAIVPGLSLAGAVVIDIGVAQRIRILGEAVGDEIEVGSLFTFAVDVDGYPDPRGGLHLGFKGGFSLTTIRDASGARTDHVPLGGAAFATAGHDWWVGNDWSLGLGLRVGGALLSAEDVTHVIFVANLSLTATLS